uniref:Uncharacterized protein n=1 Tax=Oryza sativa subsp. japonica TaxID=39947 RepID=Q6ZHL4_ORYSJ|nr:hypothetical protein [Oryza sativa Japonica Group]
MPSKSATSKSKVAVTCASSGGDATGLLDTEGSPRTCPPESRARCGLPSRATASCGKRRRRERALMPLVASMAVSAAARRGSTLPISPPAKRPEMLVSPHRRDHHNAPRRSAPIWQPPRSIVAFAGKNGLSENLMKQPASMARPSESGGRPSMFLAATSWHCVHPPSPTVSTHWDAASHEARGAAAASSPTSPRAASTNPPSATSAEPLHTCVFSGSVAGPSRQAALSYLTTQPSRMARPLLAAPHLARRRDAAAGVEARDAVRSRDVRAALRHGQRRRVGEWLRRHHHRWMTGWRGARRRYR